MNRDLLLTALAIFFTSSVFSQINHVDFDEGLVIAQNENYEMDLNQDGKIDFYINKYKDELGFTPIFLKGCFAGESGYPLTSFNARQLQVFKEGKPIGISDDLLYDYIDDDRASIYATDSGVIDEGWVHLEEQIIGVAVFGNAVGQNVFNAWMRVAVDTDNNTLIIKEYAYSDWTTMGVGSIAAGDTGISTAVKNLDSVLDQVKISPNPVRDQFQLSFNYSGAEALQISILDNAGKLISNQTANGSINQTFDTSDWAAGMYHVSFRTSEGVSTKKVVVTK